MRKTYIGVASLPHQRGDFVFFFITGNEGREEGKLESGML